MHLDFLIICFLLQSAVKSFSFALHSFVFPFEIVILDPELLWFRCIVFFDKQNSLKKA